MDSFARARPSAPSSAKAAAVHPLRRLRGVRRRRDDNAAAVEIEELDSDVMRQNSYNYFQLHGMRLGGEAAPSTGNPNEADGGATAASSSSSSRKRQRTLAERLEELCLNGAPRSSKMSGAAAAAACRQAWNRVFAAQMVAAQQRAAAQKAAAAAVAPTPPPQAAPAVRGTPPRATPVTSFDVDMDASSAAEDGDLEDAEDDDESGRDSQSFKVFGGVPDVKGMFFGSNGGRHRPMERMFRHYVTMATERSTRGDGNTTPRGDELVLFQQGPTSLEFPYSLFTPEQVEDLRARHNRKKKRFARSSTGSTNSGGGSSSSDSSWRFQELDSSDEADVSSSAEDSDMDMSGDGETKAPQHAGALSHGEWFIEGEDENDPDSDSTL